MDWFLYDNGLRHERVNEGLFKRTIFYGGYVDVLRQILRWHYNEYCWMNLVI